MSLSFSSSFSLSLSAGSSRKNEKSNLQIRAVPFHILIFPPVSRGKIATNYFPTPSRSLRNVLRLPSKVAPPVLAEWKSGIWEPKKGKKMVFGPQKDLNVGQN